MRILGISIGLIVVAAVVGYLGYQAYTYRYAYLAQTAVLNRLQFTVLNAPQWRYGTIAGVDETTSSIEVNLINGLPVRIFLPPNTYIGRQDLIREGAVYVGSLPPVQGVFADLRVGQHFAGTIARGTNGQSIASLVLVGDPL